MSLLRWDAKRDAVEPDIVAALERCGVLVWRRLPVDLLTFYRGLWLPLEVKDPGASVDKRQREQIEVIAATGLPVVRTAEQAIAALTRNGVRR